MRSHPWRSGLWMAVVLLALGALWVTFAPVGAGGQSTYVIVAGASMEPMLRWGDLVIARQTGDYRPGDIVAYRHPNVGPVIHRILASEDGRYTLKGDANAWTDSYEPSAAEILGEAWMRLPGAGKLVVQMRQPAVLSLLAIGVSVLIVSMVVPMKRPSRSTRSGASPASLASRFAADASLLQAAVFVLGLLGLLALLLALPAWTHPLERLGTRTLAYTQRGTFDYGARVTAGVYDTGTLQTGDPVYLRLNRVLSVTFDYEFVSEAPASVAGTTALRAEIRDVNGWHRALVLQPPEPFKGATASAFGLLDLNLIQDYISDLESLTGVERPSYTVVLLPEVALTGDLGQRPILAHFTPALQFHLDPLQLQMVWEGPADPDNDPLHPVEAGTLEFEVVEPNEIGLLGASISVRAARWISAIGLIFGLAGLGLLAWLVGRAQQSDPDAAAWLKFGIQIVDVRAGAFASQWPALEVSSLEDLARVAARAGTVIHRVRSDAGSEYFVQDQGHLYRSGSSPASDPGGAKQG